MASLLEDMIVFLDFFVNKKNTSKNIKPCNNKKGIEQEKPQKKKSKKITRTNGNIQEGS